MRRGVVLAAVVVAAMGQTRVPGDAQLAQARQLYNERRYDEAIKLADEARQLPATAAPASIVFARAHLEQYRADLEIAGLEAARQALKGIESTKLTPRDQVEFAIALGQLLYVDDQFTFDDRYGDAYYSRMYERERATVRSRLAASATALGSLWLTAWQAAGRPPLDGSFRFPNLPVGNYTLTVELAGFSKFTREGIRLLLNQDAVADVSLSAATVAETVTVQADTPLLNTTNAEVGVRFDSRRIEELPLGNSRDVFTVALSAAGVSQLGSGQSAFSNGVNFAVNGARLRSNNMMLDGQDYFCVGIDHPLALKRTEDPDLRPKGGFSMRGHSVGGFGSVTTNKIIATIAGNVFGKDVQAYPKYGSEKKGLPTTYYLTIADTHIDMHSELEKVELLCINDPTAILSPITLKGLVPGGAIPSGWPFIDHPAYSAACATASTDTYLRPSLPAWNRTRPSAVANRVWSLPMPTLTPGYTLVPR